MFSVVANVVRNVPTQAVANISIRPKSVVPYSSMSFASKRR